MGLEKHTSDRSALCLVAEQLQPHSQGEMLEGSVAKGCPHRGILLSLLCCLVVDKVIKRLDGNVCYTVGYALSSSVERSWLLSWELCQEVLSMEQLWCDRKQPWIHWQKVVIQSVGLPRAWTQGLGGSLSMVKMHGLLCVPTLLVLYPILLCSMCILQKLTSPVLISKAVLMIPCKHGQKIQFCFILTFWYETLKNS